MAKSLYFESGHQYMTGAAKPWYVSQGMIVTAAQAKGFTDVHVTSRGDYPASSLPPLPDGTEDDWNVVGTATRAGANTSMDLPDPVRWVVDITPAQAAVPSYTPVPTPQASPQAAPVSYAPPTYPLVVPQGVDWTTTASGPGPLIFAAATLGLVTAFLAWELFG
jgi:hypothetical protein